MAGTEGESAEPVREEPVVVVRPEARADIEEAFQYYEDKAEGLGTDFLRAVDACLAAITRFPEMYAVLYKQVRRGMLRRFPYGLFYIVEEGQIIVIACLHASRKPREWKQRVS